MPWFCQNARHSLEAGELLHTTAWKIKLTSLSDTLALPHSEMPLIPDL